MERITRAAIKDGDAIWSVDAPCGHAEVRDLIRAAGAVVPPYCTNGFITSEGRFVHRGEAFRIAEAAYQIRNRLRSNSFALKELQSPDVIW